MKEKKRRKGKRQEVDCGERNSCLRKQQETREKEKRNDMKKWRGESWIVRLRGLRG